MEKSKLLFIFGFVFFLNSNPAFSQKLLLNDQEQVEKAVTTEINAVFHDSDFLKKKAKQFDEITGTMTIDIGVQHSGKVTSFFKVEDNINNPKFTNFVSDYILKHKFYFKLNKKQRYIIHYTANF